MRLLICAPLLLAACTAGDGNAEKRSPIEPSTESPIQRVGTLENRKLDEASGLAHSTLEPGILWVINDSGPAVVYAIDHTGRERGRVKITDAKNKDWEDIASFFVDGTAYLVIADIGDNEAKRKDVTLYVIEEPALDDARADIAWRIDFSYPDGPRDAEALAVDSAGQRIYVLSKRDIPAVLYAMPLLPPAEDKHDTIIATRLGEIDSLPQPSARERKNWKGSGWHWQPTGMDFSVAGDRALVLTYGGVYLYARDGKQTWLDALSSRPQGLGLGKIKNAESIAFAPDGDSAFVTVEKKHAPLFSIDLRSASPPAAARLDETVTIMTFNVQNLFDNVDAPDKDDKAYLPIEAKQNDAHIAECMEIEVKSWRDECLDLDWSDAVLDHKLSVLANTIKQIDEGRGADIIAFQEVENAAILNRLRDEHLASSGYGPAILLEGADARGVDVAFLSRLPLIGAAILHQLTFENFPERERDTRGVLQATFELPDGSLLTGFSVHFPAPYQPTEMRESAYQHLTSLRDALPDSHHAFAAGDFNTTSTEDRQKDMLERFVRPLWTVAHDDCEGCPGTYYYGRDDTWSFLDMILFSEARGKKTTWLIRADSVRIANRTEAQVTAPGIPLRYNAARQAGVSDHWPLVVTIESKQNQ